MVYHSGHVEVICGSMFSGKTEELIRRLRRASIARQKVQVFKPVLDNRYAEEKVVSHNGQGLDAEAVPSAKAILQAQEVLQPEAPPVSTPCVHTEWTAAAASGKRCCRACLQLLQPSARFFLKAQAPGHVALNGT